MQLDIDQWSTAVDYCFSLDGCIKLWKSNRQQLAEINLDDSLSYCCFLNSFGDLIVGWKSHLFHIPIKRGWCLIQAWYAKSLTT